MKKIVFPLMALALAMVALAATGDGKKFGARDPRGCPSLKEPGRGAPTAAQVQQILACQAEVLQHSGSIGDLLYLVTDVTAEIGKGRPFNALTDSFNSIDPSQNVYPIRGTYTAWQCGVVGHVGAPAGKNCSRNDAVPMTGSCFKDTFGDWHCNLCCQMGSSAKGGYPPPTGF
jgi:hypothetical protein